MINLLAHLGSLLGFSSMAYPTETIVITSAAADDLMLTVDGNACRIREFSKFGTISPNIHFCKLIPRDFGYSIEYEDNSLYVGQNEPSVVPKQYQPGDPGFIFDVENIMGGWVIKSGANCLQIMGKSKSPEGWYVNAKPCTDSEAQKFNIIRKSPLGFPGEVPYPEDWRKKAAAPLPTTRSSSSYKSYSSFSHYR